MSEADHTPKPKKTILNSILREIIETLQLLVYWVPAYLIFSIFAFELRTIPSESMVPNLEVSDRVAVSKYAYGYSRFSIPFGLYKLLPLGEGRLFPKMPERGDVVVFQHPHLDRVMIKRLIGLPGDHIEIFGNGQISLNGALIPLTSNRHLTYRAHGGRIKRVSEYIETPPESHAYFMHRANPARYRKPQYFIVPPDHMFFLGDNRDYSEDSRVTTGHCPPTGGIYQNTDCILESPNAVSEENFEPSIGFVPLDHLIGRGETVLFTFKTCSDRNELDCPRSRVWRKL